MPLGIIEGSLEQAREGPVPLLIVRKNVSENIVSIISGMLIALPGIDSIALRRKPYFFNGLAKRKIRVSRMRTQLNEGFRSQSLNQPTTERNMASPGIWRRQPIRLEFG